LAMAVSPIHCPHNRTPATLDRAHPGRRFERQDIL
jgi:hypothetical protein